jgi:hypothetical protein
LCFWHLRLGEKFLAFAGVRISKGSPHCAQRDRHTVSTVSVPSRRVWGLGSRELIELAIKEFVHVVSLAGAVSRQRKILQISC